jgi:hypothetical protein
MPTQVTLHCYKLAGDFAWHTGVHVYGAEWYFDGHPNYKGILVENGRWAGREPHEQVVLGVTELTQEQLKQKLEYLEQHEYHKGLPDLFNSKTYNLATHNCTDFAGSLCYHLGVDEVPAKYTNACEVARVTPLALAAPLVPHISRLVGGNAPYTFVNQSGADMTIVIWGPIKTAFSVAFGEHAKITVKEGESFEEPNWNRNFQVVVHGRWNEVKGNYSPTGQIRVVCARPDGSVCEDQ